MRRLKLYNGALRYLSDWLAVRGTEAGPLFTAINKGGKLAKTGSVYPGITPNGLAKMLAKRLVAAGIVADTTWHDFRRTFAGNLLDNGADLSTVQKLMGHSSPATTGAYDRRDERTRDRALEGLHVPYLRGT